MSNLENVIEDILSKGDLINSRLTNKLTELANRNTNFNRELTTKLEIINDLIQQIANFRINNLAELAETKNNLQSVTDDLNKTKTQLQETQRELQRVNEELNTTKNAIASAEANRNELEEKVRQLEMTIEQIKTEHANKIQELGQEAKQERDDLQANFDNQLSAIQQEKINLENEIKNAEKKRDEAINNLNKFEQEQNNLIDKLATINTNLANHLKSIDDMNTSNPNVNDFEQLLQNIEAKLRSIMGGINEAVSNTTLGRPSNNTTQQVSFYNTFMGLNQEQKDAIYDILRTKDSGDKYVANIQRYIASQNPSVREKAEINGILLRFFNNDGTTLTEKQRGGKRKRKTMKKRTKKTRKLMKKYQKGGYTYSASKELDKESFIVSGSSVSNSNLTTRINPKSHNKKKSRKRSRK